MMQSGGQASGQLNVGNSGPPQAAPQPQTQHDTDQRFQAVINCHACNLQQIEAAIQANAHPTDPHPSGNGEQLARHPIYLVAYDPSNPGPGGAPAEGQPAELNMTAIRQVFSARYPHVSPDGPPEDGSHVKVRGMHVVAEKDAVGNPTGRVTFGNPEDIA